MSEEIDDDQTESRLRDAMVGKTEPQAKQEPEPEPEPKAEPESKSEPAQEPAAEPEPDATEPDGASGGGASGGGAGKHNFDKGLQRLQQRTSDLASRFENLEKTINGLAQRLTPAQKQVQQSQEPELDGLDDPENIDVNVAVPKLTKALRKALQDADETRRQLQETRQRSEAELQSIRDHQARAAFDARHPELAGRYEEIRQKVSDEVRSAGGYDIPHDNPGFGVAWKIACDRVLEKSLAEAKQKRPASTPVKSPAGTRTVPSASQASGSQQDDEDSPEYEKKLLDRAMSELDPRRRV